MKNKVKWIRRFKYFLYGSGIHRLLPASKLSFLGHLSGVSKWIHSQKNLGYSTFPTKDFQYDKRNGLYQYVIDTELGEADIDFLEFGVSRGTSFKWWVEHVKTAGSKFHGFDTFTGLPEDWGPFKKGAMSNGNAPPEIDDSRVQFYQGIFQDTLNTFLETYSSTNKKVVHLDADLYTATLFVLTTLSPYLNKGDILLFDEFNVPLHEYKAFQEWVDSFYIRYTVLGEVNNFLQVAIRVE
ncbi:MAG: class I SAM-dependent methyltransferase [Candidatus Eisenbacteria bacterium]|uniref:Class I SAM-dependent methyltransferase n=1 Tax=Eiseniibacteriota bacterium TaxID=2212470 RepID=A0A7Y2E9W5_UNCEI|nr:class I SAM-dependent methyltransferase [Candidatus Eisenbacteria bacterium]